jgi:hypothetical protein
MCTFGDKKEGAVAYKMKLNVPYQGMPHIWNISAHVGVLAEFPNMPEDVELIQRLLIERYKRIPPKHARTGGIPFIQHATGRIDLQTGFEIYWAGKRDNTLEDSEKISPARFGSVDYGSGMWAIAYMNFKLFSNAQTVWENLPDLCSPMLKNALLTKTMP